MTPDVEAAKRALLLVGEGVLVVAIVVVFAVVAIVAILTHALRQFHDHEDR